jgi:hypothetical protein
MEDNTAPVTGTGSNEGEESTTPEEVAQILNLPKPTPTEEAEEVEETAEEAPEAEEPETPEPVQPEAPAKVEDTPSEAEEVEAPSFTIEVEDANGDRFVINPEDDLEKVLENFEPKSNGQIVAILKQVADMQSAKAAYEAQQAQSQEQAAHQERLNAIQTGWDEEIKELQGQRRIDTVAQGKENERVNQVFKFMSEENQKRSEAGRPLIHSFEDALDKLELREMKEEKAEEAKKQKELTRKRGGMVGGSSAPATGTAQVYKAGSARNAAQAIQKLGLLN